MKYYTYLEGPDSDDIDKAPVYITLSEKEILDQYWEYWYNKMCEKFGKEIVDKNYSHLDCIDDWVVTYWAWESNDEQV